MVLTMKSSNRYSGKGNRTFGLLLITQKDLSQQPVHLNV